VYRNGVLLGSADYTASNGLTVVLVNGCTAGDLVEVISFQVSSVLNAIPATTGAVGASNLAGGAVTQAKLATGVAGNGPAFSAWLSATQSFTANVFTKIQFNVEEFDTANCYDNSTNYRFTPNVAGYYQVSGAFTNATILAQVGVTLLKNGITYKRLYNGVGGGNTSTGAGSCLVFLNGSTDYIELFGLSTSTQNAFADASGTYFQAALVRAA
jgi:hypothetical protein